MDGSTSEFPQTPFYRAVRSDRYSRQDAIRQIQSLTDRQLIVYEANILSSGGSLSEQDIQPFADLLSRVDRGSRVDLMLHTSGGDIDAAEKIVYMCREVASGFRVVVPEYAKSAGTLVALAADSVVMGLTSELGPIDPQLTGPGPGGATFQASAQSFIDEFERIKREVDETGSLSPAYFPLLDGLNLGFIGMCRSQVERSKQFAAKWLKRNMLKGNDEKAEQLAAELCDASKWLTHGVVIDADQAEKLGLKVAKLPPEDPVWRQIWYLHCCYGVTLRNSVTSKIFESSTVSLAFE